jgi:hypothetical protein
MLDARHYGKHGRKKRATDLASSWKFVLYFSSMRFVLVWQVIWMSLQCLSWGLCIESYSYQAKLMKWDASRACVGLSRCRISAHG